MVWFWCFGVVSSFRCCRVGHRASLLVAAMSCRRLLLAADSSSSWAAAAVCLDNCSVGRNDWPFSVMIRNDNSTITVYKHSLSCRQSHLSLFSVLSCFSGIVFGIIRSSRVLTPLCFSKYCISVFRSSDLFNIKDNVPLKKRRRSISFHCSTPIHEIHTHSDIVLERKRGTLS